MQNAGAHLNAAAGDAADPQSGNAFDEALERLKEAKKGGRALMMKGADARKQAKKLVDQMKQIREGDFNAVQNGKPAVMKAQSMPKVMGVVDRKGFHVAFIENSGLIELAKWLAPISLPDDDVGRGEPPFAVVDGVISCLESLRDHINNRDIKESGIGIQVKRIMKHDAYQRQLRLRAQELVADWVSGVIGTKRKRVEDVEDFAPEEEAEEADEKGRAIKKKKRNDILATLDDQGNERKKTEQELNALWQPDQESQKVFQERMKMRHAVMPMEKPVFDREALPPSVAPPKKKQRDDPNSSVGRVQSQLQKISNPNKKAWKSTVEGVSISGSSLTYKW